MQWSPHSRTVTWGRSWTSCRITWASDEPTTPWWLDVLEWGQASPYADFFDIGWNAPKPDLRGKVLLPFLSDHYGDTLEACKLVPSFNAREGTFSVWYHEHHFPLAPHTYAAVLAAAAGGGSKTLADSDGCVP